MAQDGQLVREARRGRQARKDLTLIEEHLEARKQALFEAFCDPPTRGVVRPKSQAIALTLRSSLRFGYHRHIGRTTTRRR